MAMWCYWQMLLPCCHCVCNLCFLFGWCCCHVALFFRIDGDVLTIRLMFLALLVRCYSHTCGCWCCHFDQSVAQGSVPLVFYFWQMLLPKWLMLLSCFWLADVIAMWLMLLPLFFVVLAYFGRCYCLVAYVIATICSVVLADVVAYHGCGW